MKNINTEIIFIENNFKVKIIKIFPALIVMLFFIPATFGGISIGTSPGKLYYNSLLKDGYAEQNIIITTNSEQKINAYWEVHGDISGWLKFDPPNRQFNISRSQPYSLKVIVTPPSDVENGDYSGFVRVITGSLGDVSGTVGSAVRVAIMIGLGVGITGEQIVGCRAGGLIIPDTEIGYPIDLSATVINDGNVKLTPTIIVDIWNQDQTKLILSKEIKTQEILPTVKRTVRATLDSNLDIGQYWVYMRVKECAESDLLTFSVFEEGGIVDMGELISVSSKVWVSVNETVPINAKFRNGGLRSVLAKFKGKIILNDKIMDLIESEEIRVSQGETSDFLVYYIPTEPGRYIITGRVLYNKKLTFEKGSILNVNYAEVSTIRKLQLNFLPLAIYFVIMFIILFLLFIIKKERKKK